MDLNFHLVFYVIGILTTQNYCFAKECKELILRDVTTDAQGTTDNVGFRTYTSTGGAIKLNFPKVLDSLTLAKVKPPSGTQANDKLNAEVTYTSEDGQSQSLRTGMTVSDPNRPLNLPFPSKSMIREILITVKVRRGDDKLPASDSLTVAMKGCYVKSTSEATSSTVQTTSSVPEQSTSSVPEQSTSSVPEQSTSSVPVQTTGSDQVQSANNVREVREGKESAAPGQSVQVSVFLFMLFWTIKIFLA